MGSLETAHRGTTLQKGGKRDEGTNYSFAEKRPSHSQLIHHGLPATDPPSFPWDWNGPYKAVVLLMKLPHR